MGQKVSKVIGRPFKNFNIENRAHKLIDKDLKPKAAPLHESSKDYIENFIKDNKDMLEKELITKNTGLDDRLKGMVVQTQAPGEIKAKKRPLPEDRSKVEEQEYGYTEPLKVSDGFVTIKQTMEMLGKHYVNPTKFPAEQMAKEYNIHLDDANKILQYFKVFNLQLPKKEGQQEDQPPSLQPPLLPDKKSAQNQDVKKQGTEEKTNI